MVLAQNGDDDLTPGPEAGEDEGFLRCRGLRFPDRPEVLSPLRRRSIRRNTYERPEADALRAQVKPEDVVLELGGGIGFTSSIMARNCNARHVHVFEANPTLIPYMREVHALNGITNATVHNATLGPRKGRITFYQRENILASSLTAEIPGSPVVAEHEIEVRNINTVMKELKPSVLVADIEGAEADLLADAKLDGLRLAVIELHPQWIGEAGTRAVFDAMTRAGLTYFPKASKAKVVTFKKDW